MDTNETSQLAIGWLTTFFGGIYYATSGPKASANTIATPPINAASTEEADFIKCDISLPTRPTIDILMLTTIAGSSWKRLRRKHKCFGEGLGGTLYDAMYI